MTARPLFLLAVSVFAGSSKRQEQIEKEHQQNTYEERNKPVQVDNEQSRDEQDPQHTRSLEVLQSMGYDIESLQVRNALRAANNDIWVALNLLSRDDDHIQRDMCRNMKDQLMLLGFPEGRIDRLPNEVNNIHQAIDILVQEQEVSEQNTPTQVGTPPNQLHIPQGTSFENCPICYEEFNGDSPQIPICGTRTVRGRTRIITCDHFLCEGCAQRMENIGRCPMCRADYNGYQPVMAVYHMAFEQLEDILGQGAWHPYKLVALLKARHFPNTPDDEFVAIANGLLANINQLRGMYLFKNDLRDHWSNFQNDLEEKISRHGGKI